jgi:hypothetical protein
MQNFFLKMKQERIVRHGLLKKKVDAEKNNLEVADLVKL